MSENIEKLKIYTAKRILTMDQGRPFATAIAVSGDRIVSTGTLETLKPYMDRHPYEIDDSFKDNILMPGFIDTHTHLLMSGMFMGFYYVGPIPSYGAKGDTNDPCHSREDVLQRIRGIVSKVGDSKEPIVCWGYDRAKYGEDPDRDMLDEISDTIPIVIINYAPHVSYANSPFLKAAGMDESTEVKGMGRYPDGRLNGWFVEQAAFNKMLGGLKDLVIPKDFFERSVSLHAEACIHNGVTAVADMAWGLFDFDREWATHEKLLDDSFPIRVSMVPYEPNLSHKFGDKRFDYLDKMRAKNTDRLQAHGIKFQNDGSFPATTSIIGYPGYLDEDTGATGDTKWEDNVEWYWPYWERGIRIHSHANGDATLEMTLDCLEELQKRKPRFDHRFTIEHYAMSNPEQAYRLAALGGAASVNIYFTHYRALLHSNYAYGPDRAEATARTGSLARAGARFCLHADFNMVVVPMKPLEGAWIAVNRLAEDDKTVVAPGERISVEQALRGITIDGAWMIDREKDLGSLEPGKLADMAILAEDPLEVDPMKLRDIEVLGTISGGVIHKANK